MQSRLIYISILLISIGTLLFTGNQISSLSSLENALLLISIFAGTISTLALALGSLFSASTLLMTRSAGLILLGYCLLSEFDPNFKIALVVFSLIQISFFSERLLSSFTIDAGSDGEDVFILRTPASIFLWITSGFIVAWLASIHALKLLIDGKLLFSGILLAVVLAIAAIFVPHALKVLLRRCVVVPHGIVIVDQVSMTDVVLLPLSKVKSLEYIRKVSDNEIANDGVFSSLTSNRNAVKIILGEKTDSLILRRGVNESARAEIDTIYLSIAKAKFFIKHFHSRFHKIEPEELTPSQEKIIEKQLGIETAPRSDAKLPSHRKKRKK